MLDLVAAETGSAVHVDTGQTDRLPIATGRRGRDARHDARDHDDRATGFLVSDIASAGDAIDAAVGLERLDALRMVDNYVNVCRTRMSGSGLVGVG